MKKEVREAMELAKQLEKTSVPTTEEIVAIYKDGMEEAEKLRKLLKPSWFVKDVDRHVRKKRKKVVKKRKVVKKKKRRASPTRKKKSL